MTRNEQMKQQDEIMRALYNFIIRAADEKAPPEDKQLLQGAVESYIKITLMYN